MQCMLPRLFDDERRASVWVKGKRHIETQVVPSGHGALVEGTSVAVEETLRAGVASRRKVTCSYAGKTWKNWPAARSHSGKPHQNEKGVIRTKLGARHRAVDVPARRVEGLEQILERLVLHVQAFAVRL